VGTTVLHSDIANIVITPNGFDLLWEQGPCLVIAKPGGILTQSPPGIDSLEIRVKQFLKDRDQPSHSVYLGVPHRIDRPASGALVLAKNAKAARRLSEQFEDRTVKKTYWAIVEADVTAESGTWEDHVRKVPGEARAEIVGEEHPGARRAILHYKVRARLTGGTWLEIQLETGRTHQIRIQAAHRNHPIMGDAQYGSHVSFGPPNEDPRRHWIALHSRQLEFHHPTTRERIEVTAPLPPAWPPFS
jgi:23S rRNA pseudouridine1911/1915/1917 synthase